MSELDGHSPAGEHTEQTEILIGRREVVGEAVTRLAKYTAPAMLVMLMSTTSGHAVCAPSGCPK
jgi:hypothetical protein